MWETLCSKHPLNPQPSRISTQHLEHAVVKTHSNNYTDKYFIYNKTFSFFSWFQMCHCSVLYVPVKEFQGWTNVISPTFLDPLPARGPRHLPLLPTVFQHRWGRTQKKMDTGVFPTCWYSCNKLTLFIPDLQIAAKKLFHASQRNTPFYCG